MKPYCYKDFEPSSAVKSRIDNAKVSFKNTRETSRVLINKTLDKAITYLNDVINKKQCVPMRRYARGVGRTAQAKAFKTQRGRWPSKSAKFFIDLVNNLKINAVNKSLDPSNMIIKSVVVNKAPTIHGRLHRAHGRINPYNKSPCHIQMIAVTKEVSVPKSIQAGTLQELTN